jgi:hypothetical protein
MQPQKTVLPKPMNDPRTFRLPPVKAGYDEDDYGERGATLLFTGLFGTMPDTTTEPIRLPKQ